MIFWFSVAAKKASQSVNLFLLAFLLCVCLVSGMNFRQSLLFVSEWCVVFELYYFHGGLRFLMVLEFWG